MSNEEVLTRKDMKQPDKFQEVAKGAIDWISGHKKNSKTLSIVVAAVVVVVAVTMVALESRNEKAGALAYEVLRAAGGELSAVPLPGVAGPFYATEADRQKAVIAAADRVLAEYPSTASGHLALLLKGDAQLKLGEAEAAVATYQKYLAETSSDGAMRFGALEGIALAREAAGKLDEAAAAWERVGREAPRFSDHADLERARLLAAAGKVEEARKLLEGFAKSHEGSPYLTDASDRLARLGAK
jgi:tetratricopeptide (TPR) repeat protein